MHESFGLSGEKFVSLYKQNKAPTEFDTVIIDPPRSGLDKKTRDYLKRINSKYIIYISCDMISLKRDLEELKEIYNINEINLIDMFKRTDHCESIVILERKTQ